MKPVIFAFVIALLLIVPVVIPKSVNHVPSKDLTNLQLTLPDGTIIERYVHVFYKKDFARESARRPGGGSECFAYISKNTKWRTTEGFVLDPSNGDGLSELFVADAVEKSFNAWNDQAVFNLFGSRDVSKTVDGLDKTSPDGKNEVMFGSIDSSGAIAVTYVWRVYISPTQKEIIEFDALFDDEFLWGDATINPNLMDLQNIATHEFGHAAGMGHPNNGCTEETMYAYASESETKKRTLNAGDIKGIKALYG